MVIDFNKYARKKRIQKEHNCYKFQPRKSEEDKINDALKKFGSHRKNDNNINKKEDDDGNI